MVKTVQDAGLKDLLTRLSDLQLSTERLMNDTEAFLCQGNDITAKPAKVCIQFLTDGLTNEYKGDTALFVSGPVTKVSKKTVFKELPISRNLETYPEPMVLLTDSNEIDPSIAKRLDTRCEKTKAVSFPAIIFSDDFFERHEGQYFGYTDIIETLEDACNCKAMAFRRSDITSDSKFVSIYTEYVGYSVKLYDLRKVTQETCEYICLMLDTLELEIKKDGTSFRKLAAIEKSRQYYKLLSDLCLSLKKIEDKINDWSGIITKLRESYDRHIDKLVMDTPLKSDSAFVVNIDLKYGVFRSQMQQFIDKIKSSPLMGLPDGSLDYPTEQYVQSTEARIDSQTSELTLLGTFSSGKTTMINTLLGHKKKLRTSRNHNTAVLMNIEYKGDTSYERYDIVYKQHLIWDLIKPNSFDKSIINPLQAKAKVLSIVEEHGSNIISLQKINGGEIRKITIRSGRKLNVKQGDIISADESLVIKSLSQDKLMLASYNELKMLVEYIESGKLSSPQIKFFTKEQSKCLSGKAVTGFIKRFAGLKSYSKTMSKQVTVNLNDVIQLMGEQIISACIEANINLPNRTVPLDEKGWLELCGNTDLNDMSAAPPFSEAPSCYMLVDHLNLFLDSEFLKNCTVNDTPGFGSVTEEHDACTERFIAQNDSRLLVMISVNSKSKDAKLVDFLNYLTNIYQNFRKNKMDEVYFMLNTFSNDVPKAQLEKECKSISDDLVRRGFSRKNIYACDLRKAIDGGVAMKELFGLPSYDIFKHQCINEMIESGISRKYTAIYNAWEEYFKKNPITVNEHIVGLEQALEDRENRIRELNRKIELVEKISVGSIEPILTNVKKNYYDYFFEHIDSTFRGNKRGTGFFFHNRTRKEKCGEAMESIRSLLPEMAESSDDIKRLVKKALLELEQAYDSSEGIDQELIDPSEVIFTLAAENIGNRLFVADDNTRAWNKSENTEYYMDQIQSMVADDYKRSAEKARRYYRELVRIFEQRRTNILKTMRHELNTTQSPELIKAEIERLKTVSVDIEQYQRVFIKTVNPQNIVRYK